MFRTSLPENSWPALFDDREAQILSTLFQLEQSQWWDEQRMALTQAQQLERLLKQAHATVPYYRDSLADPSGFKNTEQLLANWSKIPVLTRQMAQQAGSTLYSTDLDSTHGKPKIITTSGSTGQPLRALMTKTVRHINLAIDLRAHFWHKRNPHAKLVAIRPDRQQSQDGVNKDQWGSPIRLISKTGPYAIMHSSTSIDKQVNWLLKQQPEILLTMPSNLKGIVDELNLRGETLASLEELCTFGETLSPELRVILKNKFGVPIRDVYSSVEIGNIGIQCPEHEHLHLQSENALIEVLDDTGKACLPGQIGRIVITPLHNYASPLIRYELGDYAEMGDSCPCGRGLPVIRRVMGRVRNLLTLPDGSRHWPSMPGENWVSIAPIRQFQLVQKSLQEIDIRLVAERTLTAPEQDQINKVLIQKFGHTFSFNYSYHEHLKRGRSGKFEDFISELAVTS